jgi:hypothetical protein
VIEINRKNLIKKFDELVGSSNPFKLKKLKNWESGPGGI